MIIKLLAKSTDTRTIQATHFRVTDSEYPVKITFEKAGGNTQDVTMEKGMAFEPQGGFEKVSFISEVAQTIQVEATNGSVSDNRLSGTIDVNIKPLTGIQTRRITGLINVRQVIAQQDASRNTILIKNVGTEVAHVGGIDVETQGFELGVNESLPIDRAAAAEIYAVSTATGTNLHILEEFDEVQAVTIPANVLTTEIGGSILTESGDYLTA